MYKFITQYKVDFKVTKHYSVFVKAKSGMKSTFQANYFMYVALFGRSTTRGGAMLCFHTPLSNSQS